MTKENIRMSLKEADRLGIMKGLNKKELTLRQASERLDLSIKQTRRVWKRYVIEGAKGLISRKVGKPSTNKIPQRKRQRIMELVREKYPDFGPTLAREKLKERHKIFISAETLRKWMIEDGFWKPKQKKEKRVYQRRTRRSRFGELLQGDGSPHDWFEGRSEKCTLLQFVDDATSRTTAAKFFPSETTEGYLEVLEEQLKKYGRPLALYVDKYGVFRVNQAELKKGLGVTHFGRVAKDLGIELICANSPQAKGRVERKNGFLQDRLIKEMRLQGINTIEEGNAFLPQFLKKLDQRFGKEPADPEDAHRPLRPQDDLKRIFFRKDVRKLSKDLTLQHHGTLYLIQTNSPNRLRHANVEVLWREGYPIEIEYHGKKLEYKKWSETTDRRPRVLDNKEIEMSQWMTKKRTKPSLRHPWR